VEDLIPIQLHFKIIVQLSKIHEINVYTTSLFVNYLLGMSLRIEIEIEIETDQRYCTSGHFFNFLSYFQGPGRYRGNISISWYMNKTKKF
jgi:hypothetical protein